MILPVFLSTLKHISFRTIGYSINLIRNLIGRELDVIHESLLRLMSAYMHHLQDAVFVRQVHIGDAATTGCMRSDTVVTGRHH